MNGSLLWDTRPRVSFHALILMLSWDTVRRSTINQNMSSSSSCIKQSSEINQVELHFNALLGKSTSMCQAYIAFPSWLPLSSTSLCQAYIALPVGLDWQCDCHCHGSHFCQCDCQIIASSMFPNNDHVQSITNLRQSSLFPPWWVRPYYSDG